MSRPYFGARKKALQRRGTDRQGLGIALHGGHQGDQLPRVSLSGEPLMTTEQVRERLGLPSIFAVYRLVRGHRLPRVRVGGVYRFSQEQVESWIAAQAAPVVPTLERQRIG